MDARQWAELSAHLDELLLLPQSEQRARLDALEANNRAAAKSLRDLLAAGRRAEFRGFLTEPPPLLAQTAQAASLTGRELGPYVLEAEIGRGGMGSVWRARRADGRFDGYVAIKLLDAALIGRPSEQRFIREGSVLASLKHPNIAHLLDAGVAPTGQPYIVLELLEGQRIDTHCNANRLSIKARVSLFLQVLAAVAHAHAHLVLHRDLKPTNILVTDDGQVKLLDFGIATLLGPDPAARDAPLTLDSAAAFTPEYAAPEQLLHEPGSTATDVYALGLLLFVLLAGKQPYAAAEGSAMQRMRRVLDEDAPLLSKFTTEPAAARLLRGDLDNIVAKALKREPAERYATADAFAEDLHRFLANEPVKARPDSAGYRLSKFMARHQWGVALGSLAIFSLLALSAFAWLQMREAEQQRNAAVLEKKNAQAEARFVTMMLGSVGEGGKPMSMLQILDQGLLLLEKQFADDPRFVVHKLINMSGRFMDTGATDKEYAALVKAEQMARKIGDAALLAEVQCDTVETEIALGHLAPAAARLADGLQALSRVTQPDIRLQVECQNAAAKLAMGQGDTRRAFDIVKSNVARIEADATPRVMQYMVYTSQLSLLSSLYSDLGDETAAFAVTIKNLRVLEQNGQGKTEAANANRYKLAFSLLRFGEIRQALSAMAALIGRAAPDDAALNVSARYSMLYGLLLARMGETATAFAWLDRAIKDSVANGSLGFEVLSRLNRTSMLVDAQRLKDAHTELERIGARSKGHELSLNRPLAVLPLIEGNLQLAEGDLPRASATLAPLLTKVVRPLGPGSDPLDQRALLLAARIAFAAARLDDAASVAKDALELARLKARRPQDSADVGEAAMLQARIMLKRGDSSGASAAAAVAAESFTNSLGTRHVLTREAEALGVEAVDLRVGQGSRTR